MAIVTSKEVAICHCEVLGSVLSVRTLAGLLRKSRWATQEPRLKRDGCVTVCAGSLDTLCVYVPRVLECVK